MAGHKFKIRDVISPIDAGRGFEHATVIGFTTERKREHYLLKIINGTATIPITSEEIYQLDNPKGK